MDHKPRADQTEAAPCKKQQQRQPEKRALFRYVPEEDFSEQMFHRFAYPMFYGIMPSFTDFNKTKILTVKFEWSGHGESILSA